MGNGEGGRRHEAPFYFILIAVLIYAAVIAVAIHSL